MDQKESEICVRLLLAAGARLVPQELLLGAYPYVSCSQAGDQAHRCFRGAHEGEGGEQGVFGWKRGARRGRRRCEREARAIARRWGGRTLRVLNFSSCVRATTLANPSFCLRSG